MINPQSTLCPHDNSPNHNSAAQCPLNKINFTISALSMKPKSILSQINYLGMKYFGKWWVFQYVGSTYPGIIAHFSDGTLLDRLLHGQKKSFHESLVIKNKTLYEYFEASGINEFAKKNGGICTFRIGTIQSIYQTTNFPIAKDKWLEPSQDRSTGIFGDFVGTLPLDSKARKMKRAVMESALGNWPFISSLEQEFKSHIEGILSKYEKKEMCLERFCQEIVADNGSLISGIFDFKVKPLSHYFVEFKNVTLDFFELVSGLISGLDKDADKKFATMGLFVKAVLKDNYSSINSAPESNIIKRYFQLWKLPFTLQSIDELNNDYLRELATIMVLTFESISLSLSWVISYIEHNSSIKQRIIEEAQGSNHKKFSYIDLVILEAVRLGGSNPTVLTRRVIQKFELQIGKNKIVILPGTRLWVNRREANQDSAIFSNPTQFDPTNIKDIMQSNNENVKSILSKNRHEINSFNSINTEDSPRKCPARLYTIYTQALIIRALYSNYQVNLKNNNPEFNPNSPMPKPLSFGTIQINKIPATS